MDALLSHIVANYHHEDRLPALFDSIIAEDYPVEKTILIDNGSNKDTLDVLIKKYPDITVIQNQTNKGFCVAMNQGIRAVTSKFVLITGPDVVLEKGCINHLMKAFDEYPDAIVTAAKILRAEDHNCIQSAGCSIHFAGHQILHGWFQKNDTYREARTVHGAIPTATFDSTACIIDLEKFAGIDNFDEDFFLYSFEIEVGMRAKILGNYSILYIPEAVAIHGTGSEGASFWGTTRYPPLRAYESTKNRWLTILKLYSFKSILLLSPAIFIYELAVIYFFISQSVFKAYLKGILWNIVHLPHIMRKRQRIQNCRKANDSQVLCADSISIHNSLESSNVTRFGKLMLDHILWAYWLIVKRFL